MGSIGGMLSGKSNKAEDMASDIVEALITKCGLSKDVAGKISDMVVPAVIDALKKEAGGGLSGMMGKLKF